MLSEDARFKFGENWQNFLSTLNTKRIEEAEKSLTDALGTSSLQGTKFLDIGSGSGLFSLAAKRLQATVHSFDYDKHSVACARELKSRYFTQDTSWTIEQGSVLDENYLAQLGSFDTVYSWGVLHHTGNMYQAFENIVNLVKPNGYLFISIYNDQGATSTVWKRIKKLYAQSGWVMQKLLILLALFRCWGPTLLKDFLKCGNPLKSWTSYKQNRGMSAYYDLIDWVGGYPFEVAKPEEVFDFFKDKGFQLLKLHTCQGIGCNEFVFQKLQKS